MGFEDFLRDSRDFPMRLRLFFFGGGCFIVVD